MEYFDYPRGPWISMILNVLEQEVIEGNLKNQKEDLLNYAEGYLKKEMS